MKVAIAGKGGSGKTTLCHALALALTERGKRVLAVDCDPNPNLAESFGLNSASLERFNAEEGLRPAPGTLELVGSPKLVETGSSVTVLGGPPSDRPLADAIARGIAGVLVAPRFDFSLTDLGAGPELAGVAVGGVLNPAELCLVMVDERPAVRLAHDRIVAACDRRSVPTCSVPTGICAGRGVDALAWELVDAVMLPEETET